MQQSLALLVCLERTLVLGVDEGSDEVERLEDAHEKKQREPDNVAVAILGCKVKWSSASVHRDFQYFRAGMLQQHLDDLNAAKAVCNVNGQIFLLVASHEIDVRGSELEHAAA